VPANRVLPAIEPFTDAIIDHRLSSPEINYVDTLTGGSIVFSGLPLAL
jgi:hypothetical protein